MTAEEEFHAAYDAWRRARDRYNDDMRRVMAGEKVEWEQIHSVIREFNRLHLEMLEKSKPLVHWKN